MTQTIILLLIAYLAGSLNFSILLFKILGREDPRKSFSSNPGTTNVFRQAGIYWALVVLLLEVGRAGAVAFASLIFLTNDLVPWVGLALITGNRFPCFHGFRGGKGVAAYLGFTAVLTAVSASVAALVWVIVYKIMHQPFIASFFMVFVLAVGSVLELGRSPIALAGIIATSLFIFYNHKSNILIFLQSKKLLTKK